MDTNEVVLFSTLIIGLFLCGYAFRIIFKIQSDKKTYRKSLPEVAKKIEGEIVEVVAPTFKIRDEPIENSVSFELYRKVKIKHHDAPEKISEVLLFLRRYDPLSRKGIPYQLKPTYFLVVGDYITTYHVPEEIRAQHGPMIDGFGTHKYELQDIKWRGSFVKRLPFLMHAFSFIFIVLFMTWALIYMRNR